MSDSDGDLTVGTETAGEIVNHAIIAVICALLTSILGIQLAATLKKDRLVRTLKRTHGVTHIPHASIYAAAGSQIRLFQICGLAVTILVDIRALDPLGRLFIPASWMRLVNWNAIAVLIVTFAITLEINLRLLILLKRNTIHRFSRYFFRSLAAVTVVMTEISFGFYIAVAPSKSGAATIAFHGILLFIIILSVALWDIIVLLVRVTVRDTMLATQKPSQPAAVLGPIAETGPVVSPDLVRSLVSSPPMSSEMSSDGHVITSDSGSHGAMSDGPLSPEPVRAPADSITLDVVQDPMPIPLRNKSTTSEADESALVIRSPTITRTLVSGQSSDSQSAEERARRGSRTAQKSSANAKPKERAVASALRKMYTLTIGVHVVLVIAFSYTGYLIFISAKADTRAKFTLIDMANPYVLLAFAVLTLWYGWKPASWHIVTTPMSELISLVKQGITSKPKRDPLSGAGSGGAGRPERPSQELALRSPSRGSGGVRSGSSHAEEQESDPNEYTNSGSGV